MSNPLHYSDARWRDVPRLLAVLVYEVQQLRLDLKNRDIEARAHRNRIARAART